IAWLPRPDPRLRHGRRAGKGIAATSGAPGRASTAPIRKRPPGSPARPKTTKQPINAMPTAIAAVTAWPGSLTAIPQITSSAEIPTAGTAAECRGRRASAITAAPSSSEAAVISRPARIAESIAESPDSRRSPTRLRRAGRVPGVVGCLAEPRERGAHLRREELGLLPGGEVAPSLRLAVVDEVVVGLLHPVTRGLEDLAGEHREGHREREVRGRV